MTYTHVFNTPVYKGSISINTGLYINGKWVDPVDGGEKLDVVDPTTGKLICQVSGASAKDIDIAVDAAKKAFKTTWGLKTPGFERGRLLNKLADLIKEHADQLSALEALNVGKQYGTTKIGDIEATYKTFKYFAGWADKVQGKTIETNENKFAYTRHEPYGVVGGIIPWNAPMLMTSWKLAPALATGNTCILKPSEITPLSALYFADLVHQAGFPPGTVNIINGSGPVVGSAIAAHPAISKVAFTGSIVTGRKVMKAAAESNLKAVTLELGGKSPTIVFDDADVEQAVKWASMGVFTNMGQACIAGSRIYVQEGIYDQFLSAFSQVAQHYATATGGPFDEGVIHGPQVSQTQYDRVMGYINSGKEEGAKVHVGGERHGNEGYFIKPTVFVDAKPDMKIMKEEIFGPVCSIVKFKTEEEVTEWANDTTYGLAANILTQNASRSIRMAHALEAGVIFVNCAMMLDLNVPFGGYKQSGLGRECGEYALATYTQVKAVHVNLGIKI